MNTNIDSHTLDYLAASELLSISKPTLERMVRAGTIPHVKIGRRVIFRRESLDVWLRDHEKGGATDER